MNFIGKITQDDITQLIEFCTKRSDDFSEYYISNITDLASKHKVTGLLPLLKNLLENSNIYSHEREKVLSGFAELDDNKTNLISYFNSYLNENKIDLAEIANEYLITKYFDDDAIQWRFDNLKSRKFPFKKVYQSGMNPYTDHEEELDHLTFAKCLIGVRRIELMENFNDLLLFSFELRSNHQYEEYSNYLQKIIYYYYLELKNHNNIAPLKNLTYFISKVDTKEKESFNNYMRDLQIEYSKSVLKPNNILDCVKKYNTIKSNSYLPISSDFELYNLVLEIINSDLYNFVNNEGFYKLLIKGKLSEDTIQKILKVQIENALHKRGFRSHDIIREPQTHNDKRPDFIISYGFIGPIVLELKFITNNEIKIAEKRGTYKDKLENNYRKGFHAKYGIYMVLEKDKKNHSQVKEKLINEYADLKEWSICFFKCYEE